MVWAMIAIAITIGIVVFLFTDEGTNCMIMSGLGCAIFAGAVCLFFVVLIGFGCVGAMFVST